MDVNSINDLKNGENVRIYYANGDIVTGTIDELGDYYIDLTLDMCVDYTVVRFNIEWVDTIEKF